MVPVNGASSRQGGSTSLPRRLLSNSAVYGLGGVASQAISIVLVPLYAHQLGVANFGALAVLTTTQSLTVMIVGLALPQAFFRSYLNEARSDVERAAVLRGTLALRLATSFIGLAGYSVLAIPLTLLLFGNLGQLPIVLLVGPIAFLDTMNLIPLSLLRAQRRSGAYAALAFSRAILAALATIVLVVVYGLGIGGVLMGTLLSACVATGAGWTWLARSGRLQLEWNRVFLRHMLVFSLPLVPAAVAAWTLSLSDRYVVQGFEGNEAVGIYAAGYTIGLAMSALIVQPFGLAWAAEYWELAKDARARAIFARILTGFTVLASMVALGLSAFGTDAVRILLTPSFEAARFVVPFSAFAYVCYGVYSILGTGLNLASQTRWLPIAIGIPAGLNVLLNLALVPLFGYMGAAWSTLICYALLALLTGIFAQHHYPIPWQIYRTVGTLVLGFVLAELAVLGPDNVLWRIACFAVFLPVLFITRALRREDLSALTSIARR